MRLAMLPLQQAAKEGNLECLKPRLFRLSVIPAKKVIDCEMDLRLREDDGWLVFCTTLPPPVLRGSLMPALRIPASPA